MTLITEKVGYEERRKRSRRMHNIARKLLKRKELLAPKHASEQVLHKRALKLARMLLRKKVSGIQGGKYNSLNTSQKMAIDKMVDSLPKRRHKELAKRLMPYVIRAEQARLAAVRGRTAKSIKEELSEEITTSRRLKATASAQRTVHLRKDHARAHSRPTRPHDRGGESRALSRVNISTALKQIFPGINPKTKEGKTALAIMRSRFMKGMNRKKGNKFKGTRFKMLDLKRISEPHRNRTSPASTDRRTLSQDYEMIKFAEILFEGNSAKLDKLFVRGLVDKDKIEQYRRIFSNLKNSVKYRRYQDDIVNLLNNLVKLITTNEPIYQRVRNELIAHPMTEEYRIDKFIENYRTKRNVEANNRD